MIEPVLIRGVQVYPFTSGKELVDFVTDKKTVLIAINAEKVVHATKASRKFISENIGYADGAGVVYALKRKIAKQSHVVKIAGCELWLDIINLTQQSKSFYLIGAKEEVIQETVSKLKRKFDGISIVGYRNGYLRNDDELKELSDDIQAKKPDVVFVAMGSPKQEQVILELQAHHKALYAGLGGSFDVYTGKVDRAPEWFIRHNLEWAYRLMRQPARIKRQIYLFRFAKWLILNDL